MTSIVETARDLMAIMSPVTGTRATGVVTVTASGADVALEQGTYAIPIYNTSYRDDLPIKALPGPNADKTWTVTSGGTDVSFVANIGGDRYNRLTANLDVKFDPPLSGIASAVIKTGFSGGADATGLGAVPSMVMYEQFEGRVVDLKRSNLKLLPGIMVVWTDGEPADGASTSQVDQQRLSSFATNNHETYQILIIVERRESDHMRRLEGTRILDTITSLLTNQVAYDGRVISTPSGLQIRRRWRRGMADQTGAVKWYVYGLDVGAMQDYCMTDTRTYNDLDLFVLDEVKPVPAAQGGDIATVGDGLPGTPGVEIENT
jgi:hypothetical protein